MTGIRIEHRSWVVLSLAAATWSGAVGARWWGGIALLAPAALAGVALLVPGHRSRLAMAALLATAGWWSGHTSLMREQAILDHPTPFGPVVADIRLLGDPREGQYGWWALGVPDPSEPGRPSSIPLLLSFRDRPPGRAGERVWVEGERSGRTGRIRGDPYSGVIRVDDVEALEAEGVSWWSAGNLVRDRALERLQGRSPERALLAGFLVGDTTGVPEADMEAMRRTGLTHLVAVSGSNVSLFLTLTLVAAGPLAAGPRRRAVIGLAALVVLVVATRWESSVVRASVMAGLVLSGRVGGWALDAATALAVTVMGVVVVFGELATDVGFTLSVLATLGVLVGATLDLEFLPGPVATALAATIGAQLAVAPVLLAVFGQIPLLSPLTNLVAVPVVAVTTAVGAVAVALGWEWLIDLSTLGASAVLAVARTGAGWPQLAWVGFGLVVVAAGLGAVRRLRPVIAVAAGTAVALALTAGRIALPEPSAVVLDVGQGDAILVMAGEGRRILIDGGPDPAGLEEKLANYGVPGLDLVVLTHVHADHAAGLEAVIGRRSVGEMWLPTPPHETPASRRVRELVAEHGVPARSPPVGNSVAVGDLQVEILGPVRRYASPNDQSIVLRLSTAHGPRLLLTGDVETHAQADLVGLEAEILKVPHQGAATSDLEWLGSLGAEAAIVSVGPNDFGHPSAEVVTALTEAGARVRRTDLEGDVVVPLAPR